MRFPPVSSPPQVAAWQWCDDGAVRGRDGAMARRRVRRGDGRRGDEAGRRRDGAARGGEGGGTARGGAGRDGAARRGGGVARRRVARRRRGAARGEAGRHGDGAASARRGGAARRRGGAARQRDGAARQRDGAARPVGRGTSGSGAMCPPAGPLSFPRPALPPGSAVFLPRPGRIDQSSQTRSPAGAGFRCGTSPPGDEPVTYTPVAGAAPSLGGAGGDDDRAVRRCGCTAVGAAAWSAHGRWPHPA